MKLPYLPPEIINKINTYLFYMYERDKYERDNIIKIKNEYNKQITDIYNDFTSLWETLHTHRVWGMNPPSQHIGFFGSWLGIIGFYDRQHDIHTHPPRRAILNTEYKKENVRYYDRHRNITFIHMSNLNDTVI